MQDQDREDIQQTITSVVSKMLLKAAAMFLVAFVVQGAGLIWWAATLTNSVSNNARDISQIESNRYRDTDASRDLQLRDERIAAIADSVTRIETVATGMNAAITSMSATLAVVASRVERNADVLDSQGEPR